MTWRCPTPIIAHRFAGAMLVMGLVEGLAGGYANLPVASVWMAIAIWGVGLASFLGACLGLPLVQALGLTRSPHPSFGTWVAYYACHLILPYPLVLAREALMLQAGVATGPLWLRLWLLAAQFSYIPLLLLFMEHEAHVHQSSQDADSALDEALTRLAATRFGLGQVLQGQRAALLDGMQRQLLPTLARLEAKAQSLGTAELPAWAALMAEVESLANREVREFSHRLHPEAIRFGLVPALQALFADPEVAARADLWVHAGLDASPALAAAPHTKGRLLGAYRVVEALLVLFLREADPESFALVELRWAEHGLLEIAWGGVGGWPTSEEGGPSLAWRLVEARVALLEGSWRVDAARLEGEGEAWAASRQLLLRLPFA